VVEKTLTIQGSNSMPEYTGHEVLVIRYDYFSPLRWLLLFLTPLALSPYLCW